MDFTILKRAGVPQTLFASILKVSPPAVSKWTRGGSIHPLRRRAVAKVLDAVACGIEAELLPVSETNPSLQHAAIKKIITDQLRTPAAE